VNAITNSTTGALMRTFTFSAMAAAVALTIGGCGSDASRESTTPAPGVLSSISDGAVLSDALQWTARPVGIRDSAVARVEFLIDGRVLWTNDSRPYIFGLTEQSNARRLFPSLLGTGAHRLGVRVVTTSGTSASTSARVTVAATAPVPSELFGTFTREVTRADVRRTQAFRTEPGSQALPSGTWRLHITGNGLISFDDPLGSGGNETFTASPAGMLALQGPANWLNPPDRKGSFCGVEPNGAWHWAAHRRSLVLTPRLDRCADRNSLFAGVWKRS
jgi:hypothetical protein